MPSATFAPIRIGRQKTRHYGSLYIVASGPYFGAIERTSEANVYSSAVSGTGAAELARGRVRFESLEDPESFQCFLAIEDLDNEARVDEHKLSMSDGDHACVREGLATSDPHGRASAFDRNHFSWNPETHGRARRRIAVTLVKGHA